MILDRTMVRPDAAVRLVLLAAQPLAVLTALVGQVVKLLVGVVLVQVAQSASSGPVQLARSHQLVRGISNA